MMDFNTAFNLGHTNSKAGFMRQEMAVPGKIIPLLNKNVGVEVQLHIFLTSSCSGQFNRPHSPHTPSISG
jgi:hypothetical protein